LIFYYIFKFFLRIQQLASPNFFYIIFFILWLLTVY